MSDEPPASEVEQILVGHYLETSNGGPWALGSSVTLIKDGSLTILVDCTSPWEEQKLMNALKKHKVKPNQVNYLICTHGHIDHVGNLNLFRDAVIILDSDFGYRPGLYGKHADRPFVISTNVEILYTPGHTNHDLSVVVKNVHEKETVVVTGDLFFCEADLANADIWQQLSWNPDLQLESRNKILNIAKFIIPGHGPIFEVPNDNGSLSDNNSL